MLFLCVLVEMGGAEGVGLSFAHSSLIVRLSFAESLNRKNFCFGDVKFQVLALFGDLPIAPAKD